jgi:transcription antitermination factor NusG
MEIPINDNLQDQRGQNMGWYALYVRHQHENTVAKSLSGRGFEVFLPVYEEIRQWSDRQMRLSVPLFPCYVFVRTFLEQKTDILVTPGVHAFVSFNNRPASIPQSEIEDLRRVATLTNIEPHPFLRCGDWVRVKSGPFEGIKGILVRKKDRTRLVLSVELLQKAAALEIDAILTERMPLLRGPHDGRYVEVHTNRFGVAM